MPRLPGLRPNRTASSSGLSSSVEQSAMNQSHSLVFCGEVLPGFDVDEVRDALGRLLGISEQRAAQLFSGERIVLKRQVGSADVDRYVRHLAGIGARVDVMPPRGTVGSPMASSEVLADAAAAPPLAASRASAPAMAMVPAAEEMDCPRCGHRQPKRTLCQSCSTDMPRLLAAQREAAEEERAARLQPVARRSKGAGGQRVLADGIAETEFSGSGDSPSWVGLSFRGRLPRLDFLAAGMVSLVCALALMLVGARLESIPVIYLGLAVQILLQMRLAVLRCHDIGWSGWFALIALVPIVGLVLSLILLFFPGNPTTNAFGPAARSAIGRSLIIALLSLLAVVTVSFHLTRAALPLFVNEVVGDMAVLTAISNGTARFSRDNRVVFYGPSDCPCATLVEQMRRGGIDALLVDPRLELSSAERELLAERLDRVGLDYEAADLIVDVNGTLLANPVPPAILGRLRLQN